MKISVRTALASDKIIDLLCGYRENGVEFKFLNKSGINLEFEAANLEESSAAGFVKTLIRETDFGKVLYFSVQVMQ